MCVEIISYFSFFHSPPFFKEGWSQTGVVFEVVLFSVMLNSFQHLKLSAFSFLFPASFLLHLFADVKFPQKPPPSITSFPLQLFN